MEGWPIPMGQTLVTYLAFTAIIIGRYFLIVWPIHWALWKRPAEKVKARRLSKREPTAATIRNEIKLSNISAFIYAAPAAIVLEMWKAGGTAMYAGLPQGIGGWGWVLASAFIYLFAQDTWFYFTHRIMHHRKLFKWTHEGHHRSVQPTPWASFSFDAIEAVSAAWRGVAAPCHGAVHSYPCRHSSRAFNDYDHQRGLQSRRLGSLSGALGARMVGPPHHHRQSPQVLG